jgi:hypothetical protein
VFINYRTGDGDFASALLDRELSAHFGADSVFLASRTIEPGRDFEHEILTQLRACNVVLAVIGRAWLHPYDETGRSRLELPGDWVRRELVEAAATGIPVIPVLLDDTPRLSADDLPADLAGLERAQYLKLRHRHVGDDVRRIVHTLRDLDRQATSLTELDLRSYLTVLSTALRATPSWMPYDRLDRAFLERSVTVHPDAPTRAPGGALPGQDRGLLVGEIPWAAAIREVPIAVVLADAGYGKTWLLRRHCLRLCEAALGQLQSGVAVAEVTVPLLVHAHQLAARWHAGRRPWEALLDAAVHGLDLGLRDEAGLRDFLAGRLNPSAPVSYVLIDAYDEVFDDELRDALRGALGWLAGLARTEQGPRLLLTSRPARFASPFHPLGGSGEGGDGPTPPTEAGEEDGPAPPPVHYLCLGVLAEQQVRRLWARWYELRGGPVPEDRLSPALAPGSAIRQAVRVPLVAAFCAWVAESESVAPNRSGLYEQVVDRFLGMRWQAGPPSDMSVMRQDPALRARFRDAFTELAWQMAAGAARWRDAVPVAECESVLGTSLTGVARARSRTFDAVRGFGILVTLGEDDLSGTAPVAWIHRSVHQFIAAQRLTTLPEADVAALVRGQCWFRPEWRDVLDFAIGLEARPGAAGRAVTAVVRALALDPEDGLGWFATAFVSAGAGMPLEPDRRGQVVARVWRLHWAGLLPAARLARVLALTPEGDPTTIADIVRASAEHTGAGQETWDALAWCGAPGTTALRNAVVYSASAAGAALALYGVAPDTAVAAVRERIRDGLPVHAEDAPVLRELPEPDVARLRAAFRRSPASQRLARCLGWTANAGARADLVVGLADSDPDHRAAAVAGLAAGFGTLLDDDSFHALLEVALHDRARAVRTLAREELLAIGQEVPWVRHRVDQHFEELHRDDTGSQPADLDGIAARLTEVGPATLSAVAMLEAEPALLRGPVWAAMMDLTARALNGELSTQLTTRVAMFVGDSFVQLARERLEGSVRLTPERLRQLAGGLCYARPRDPQVFDSIVACIARNPDPALGIALRLHELPAIDKAKRLLTTLSVLRVSDRPAVQVWAEVLWETLLEIPHPIRGLLHEPCVAATEHLLGLQQ